jgi:general secretion pathway protein C
MLSIHPRIPTILAVVAALAMVLATGWQAYSFWQSENAPGNTIATNPDTTRSSPAQQVPELNLSSVAIFGDANRAESAQKDVDIDNLPETNLKLVLRGVMSASGDFPGSALVEDSKRNTDAYIVGDELPGNATLRTVRADRIIIERSGALENLYFPEDEDRSGIDLAANESIDNGNSGSADYVEQPAQPASFSGPSTSRNSDQRREEIRQRLEQLRNRLRGN